MIRSTVKFLLLLSLAAVFVFLYQTNGFVNIRWRGVSTSMHIGTFAVVFVFLFWVFYYIMSILSYLSMVTKNVSNFWKTRKREEGERLVEEAFSDLAAGMPEVAFRKVSKAMDYVDSPFALWGYVQSVHQMGQIPREKSLGKLLGSKHMSFLGHRFRIEHHLKAREDDLTLEAAENAKKIMPHSPWLLKILFDAYIKKGSYDKALDVSYTLAALGQRGAKSKLSLAHYLIAKTQEDNEHKITNLQKAHDYDPSNVLVALELAQLYLKTDKLRKAIHVIEVAWKVAQHPSLAKLYAQCHSGLTSPELVSAMLKLLDIAPNSIEGYVALIESCIRVEMYPRARLYLEKALHLNKGMSFKLYQLRVELTKKDHAELVDVENWVQKVYEFTHKDEWVCGECQMHTPDWSAVCPQCQQIDTLCWITEHSTGAGFKAITSS